MPKYPVPPDQKMFDIGAESDRMLRLPEVRSRVGLSRSGIYKKIQQGRFPLSRQIFGTSSVGWRESDVDAYLAQCQPRE
jgi:prophage regulatory protein